MKHLSEEDLVLMYYGEPGASDGAHAHLAECGECRAAADSLAQTLNLCNEWSVPTPDAGFERRVWQNRPRIWTMPRAWIAVAAAAAVLIAVFLLGRQSKTPQPSIMAGLSTQARERILEISLADHLDRTGMLLTEISNGGEFAAERGRAQDLVEEGRLMRQTLARQGASPTLTFLDEVERFLIEIAHTPDSVSASEVRELQQRIGSNSLIFKVRVIESNLRTQGQRL
jgi:hypothetical protein